MPDAPPITPPAPPLLKTIIPAEMHERGWAKDWLEKPFTPETSVELFKKLDGAETLIGRKIGIPDDKAKPEEVDKFYSALRPAKAEDYEIKLGEKPDEDFAKALREASHHAGMSKAQVARQLEKLVPVIAAKQKAAAAAQAKFEQDFDGLVAQAFAKEGEAPKVLARVGGALKEFTPEAYKPFVEGLDNKAMAVLTGVINAIMLKYVPEDQLNNPPPGGGNTGNDKAALQEEARKLMAEPGYRDFQHKDHERLNKRIKEIYANPAFK